MVQLPTGQTVGRSIWRGITRHRTNYHLDFGSTRLDLSATITGSVKTVGLTLRHSLATPLGQRTQFFSHQSSVLLQIDPKQTGFNTLPPSSYESGHNQPQAPSYDPENYSNHQSKEPYQKHTSCSAHRDES